MVISNLNHILTELQQEFDISKVASETVENVKEKVSGLIPDKVKEMIPLEKKPSVDRPESGKSQTSESETVTDEKSASEKSNDKKLSKDENNNPDQKKPEEEEVN